MSAGNRPHPSTRFARAATTRAPLQAGFFVLVFLIARSLTVALGLPVPPGVLGLLVVLAALRLRVLSVARVEAGGDLLLRHLPLFLVPIAVGLLAWVGALRGEWPRLVAILAVSTVLAVAAAGSLAAWLSGWRRTAPSVAAEHRVADAVSASEAKP
jgi:holin-like protein